MSDEQLEVYVALVPGGITQAEVLRVTDTTVQVRMQSSPWDLPREFRLPLEDLKSCHPVSRNWSERHGTRPKKRGGGYTITKHRAEFFLSEQMAKTYLTIGRDVQQTLRGVEHELSQAIDQLEALFQAGGWLPVDSPIPGQVARLQAALANRATDQFQNLAIPANF